MAVAGRGTGCEMVGGGAVVVVEVVVVVVVLVGVLVGVCVGIAVYEFESNRPSGDKELNPLGADIWGDPNGRNAR